MNIPDHLVYPLQPFAADYMRLAEAGESILKGSSVVFVGLARNCGPHLRNNLLRLATLAESCGGWHFRAETNDNEDDTAAVLDAFVDAYPEHASYRNQTLNREHYGAEFAGRRTVALAEYRTACQEWVRENAADTLFTVVIDLDAWGGWSHAGVLNGVGWLAEKQDAYGMASVSLMQHPAIVQREDGTSGLEPTWLGYDAWAFRLNTYVDAYTNGVGGWFHQWIPFVGSEPIRVCSAFGGMCIYRTSDFLLGSYDGSTDCEHTALHKSIAERTGRSLYYNPSQRMIMRWMEQVDAARQHGHD
jgi:hypothetical protein